MVWLVEIPDLHINYLLAFGCNVSWWRLEINHSKFFKVKKEVLKTFLFLCFCCLKHIIKCSCSCCRALFPVTSIVKKVLCISLLNGLLWNQCVRNVNCRNKWSELTSKLQRIEDWEMRIKFWGSVTCQLTFEYWSGLNTNFSAY